MIFSKKLTPAALATALAISGLAAPGIANAELSASAGVASFYLWRGLDISAGAPQMSGSLDYAHDSGAYAGIWVSSEEAGSETDLYFGYAGELGPVSYDVSYWDYLYPSDNTTDEGLRDNNLSELIVGLGMADAGLTMYFGNDKDGAEDYVYTTLDYSYEAFNFMYGFWSLADTSGQDDAHLTVAYSAADNFTFTVTQGMCDTDCSAFGYDEDLLFHVAYTLPIEM